jgi:hypothetical protein
MPPVTDKHTHGVDPPHITDKTIRKYLASKISYCEKLRATLCVQDIDGAGVSHIIDKNDRGYPTPKISYCEKSCTTRCAQQYARRRNSSYYRQGRPWVHGWARPYRSIQHLLLTETTYHP